MEREGPYNTTGLSEDQYEPGSGNVDFSIIEGKKKTAYIAAVQAGMDRDYQPMARVFSEVISRTLELYEL